MAHHQSNEFIEIINCIYIEFIKKAICIFFSSNSFNQLIEEDLIKNLLNQTNQLKQIQNYKKLELGILKFIQEELKED